MLTDAVIPTKEESAGYETTAHYFASSMFLKFD